MRNGALNLQSYTAGGWSPVRLITRSPAAPGTGLGPCAARMSFFAAVCCYCSTRSLPSPDLVRGQWEDLKEEAAGQHRTVFALSSLMALSTVRALPANLIWLSRCARTATIRARKIFAEGRLDHYRTTLGEIRETGYLAYCAREYGPYLRAAGQQFSSSHQSLTERLLQRRRSAEPSSSGS